MSKEIDYYFIGNCNFNKNVQCNLPLISVCLHNFQLKIVLPILPDSVEYDQKLITNLIKQFKLNIGGCEILRLNNYLVF